VAEDLTIDINGAGFILVFVDATIGWKIVSEINAGSVGASIPSFKGALVALPSTSANQTLSNTTWTPIGYDTEEYDTDNFHDNAVNNSRLTVPAGVSRVKLTANVYWQQDNVGRRIHALRKNGAQIIGSFYASILPEDGIGSNTSSVNLASPVLSVSEGDYFEINAYQDSGGNLDIDSGDINWFAIEVIE
jgi:hypothetical protein